MVWKWNLELHPFSQSVSQALQYLNILFLRVNIELLWPFSNAKQMKSFKDLLAGTKAFILKKLIS